MLNTTKIQFDIEGAPKGEWVQGAIDMHRVPRMSGPLVAPNLNDRELMVLWGLYHEQRGWAPAEWREYHKQDAHTGFSEFARWLHRRYGVM